MSEVRVALPAHLRALAGTGPEVRVELPGPPTIGALLDALEAAHPSLAGTIRAHAGGPRRAYMRYHACGEDLSFAPDDAPLPEAVARGRGPVHGDRSDRRRVAAASTTRTIAARRNTRRASRARRAGAALHGQLAERTPANWPCAPGRTGRARTRRTGAPPRPTAGAPRPRADAAAKWPNAPRPSGRRAAAKWPNAPRPSRPDRQGDPSGHRAGERGRIATVSPCDPASPERRRPARASTGASGTTSAPPHSCCRWPSWSSSGRRRDPASGCSTSAAAPATRRSSPPSAAPRSSGSIPLRACSRSPARRRRNGDSTRRSWPATRPTCRSPTGARTAILSVFGVIFAPDPEAAAAELARAAAPDGRIVLAAWIPGGAISQVTRIWREAVMRALAGAGRPAALRLARPGRARVAARPARLHRRGRGAPHRLHRALGAGLPRGRGRVAPAGGRRPRDPRAAARRGRRRCSARRSPPSRTATRPTPASASPAATSSRPRGAPRRRRPRAGPAGRPRCRPRPRSPAGSGRGRAPCR